MRFYWTLILLFSTCVWAENIHTADWIAHPTASSTGFGVFHFRKSIQLESVAASADVQVSADNRYRLFVNGKPVCFGPQRGDVAHWRYETIDIAAFLQPGENTIAALVHNAGPDFPMAQDSYKTGFVLFCDVLSLQTDSDWKVMKNKAYDPITLNELEWWKWAGGWYACGFTDELDAEAYPWGWQEPGFDDSAWPHAKKINGAWKLEPRRIPFLQEKVERFVAVRRDRNIDVPAEFLTGNAPLTVPANKRVTILLDMGQESVGFPELWMSGGLDARIKITYAETLFESDGEKGNRNEVDGKNIRGYWDIYHADGGDNRLFRPLWLRTFRYVQLDVRTQSDSLVLHDYYQVFTAYPFELNATFESDASQLEAIWNVAWRTLRCCALESYTDCPYYEQLNYPGDTRLQAYSTLYLSGDDRLMRDAIRVVSYSHMSNGLTQACYPIRKGKEIKIPTYGLFWISMLHDYYMLRDDTEFIEQFLPQLRSNLNWFKDHVDHTGMLYGLEMWNFVDWAFTKGTPNGAIRDVDGYSGFVSLQFAYTLEQAAELLEYFGYMDEAAENRELAQSLKNAVVQYCYNPEKKLFADSPEKKNYSQHSNIFAILTDAVSADEQPELMDKILSDASLTQCTTYFSFYLFKVMQKTGKDDLFLENLHLWHNMLALGLSTFSESGDDKLHGRSDCHAWSAHPAYFFLSLVCGILPAEPGFQSVVIQPALGDLNEIKAKMPHPLGSIIVDLSRSNKGAVEGFVQLPPGLTGSFKWNGKTIPLPAGKTTIDAAETAAQARDNFPHKFALAQNYPNPFNHMTKITYSVDRNSDVQLQIYNALGQKVKTLVDGEHTPGTYEIAFDAQSFSSGTFLYRLQADDRRLARKLLLLK